MALNNLLVFYVSILANIKSSVVVLVQQVNSMEDDFSAAQLKLIVILVIIFAFVAIFGLTFVVRSYRELKKQYAIIESQHEEIAEKNEELGAKNETLEEINMEKNNMISVVAHDLKAPLGNIMGLVELIKLDQQVLTKEQLKYLELLKKVSTETTEMVDVMLDVHRIESDLHQLTLHKYNIIEILEKVIRLHEPAAELKKAKFVFEPGVSSYMMNTDKQYLQQIVSNIVQNAVDFAPKNSSITIELLDSDKYMTLNVIDEGQGITESDQKRLFGGYQKMSGNDGIEKPSGYGLAIVYRLLEKLHGKIDVKSVFGHGTTITIVLTK